MTPPPQFAPTPPNGLVSNSNYFLYSDSPIIDVVVEIYVGETIESDLGFGFQVNCWSPVGPLCQWQQYVIAMADTQQLSWAIQNWNHDMSVNCVHAGNLDTVAQQPWVTLPQPNMMPAGWRILISLSNDVLGNVVGFSFLVTDNEANTRGSASGQLLDQDKIVDHQSVPVTPGDLAPIRAVQVTLVGPTTGPSGEPLEFGSTRLTSGAGTITYYTSNQVTALADPPAGTTGFYAPGPGSSLATGESANSSYGVLPAGPDTSFSQTFGIMTPFEQLVALDGAGHVHEFRSTDGNEWQVTDVTQAAFAPVAVGYTGLSGYPWPQTLSKMVMYLDANGHANELTADATHGWSHGDLTHITGAVPAVGSAISGYWWEAGGSKQIVYFDEAEQVIELFIAHGMKAWGRGNLSTLASGPPAVAGSPICGYQWPLEKTKQVVYLDGAGHVHELYLVQGSPWAHADLSARTGAPAAAPGSHLWGYPWAVGNSKQVVYLDSAGHVHELWIVAGSTWKHADLSAMTGAPPAAYGMPIVAYEWAAGRSKQVAYFDHAGHVNELWIVAGSTWKHADLTAITGAPPAVLPSGITGFQSTTARSKQVAYLGPQGHIHQLRIASGGAWGHVDVSAASGAAAMAAGTPVSGYSWLED